jgi:signal transduction histidine kinase
MKQLGISKKFFWSTLATSLLMAVVIIVAAYYFMVIGFAKNQAEQVINNNKRGFGVINEYVEQMTSKAKDWASWDDSFYFLQDSNQDFIKVNMEDASFEALDVNLVRFVNTKNEIIFEKGHVPNRPEYEEIVNMIPITTEGTKGVIKVQDLPMIFTTLPVLKSDGTGPSSGTITFGRIIDESFVAKITSLVMRNIYITEYSEAKRTEYETKLNKKFSSDIYLTNVKDENNTATAISILNDYNDNPTLFLKAEQPNTVFIRGVNSFCYFATAIIVLVVVSGFISYLFLSNTVIKRLKKLNSDVVKIGTEKNFDILVDETGNDEVSFLGKEINGTMKTLKTLDSELYVTNAKIQENIERIEAKNAELEDVKNAALNILEDQKELEEALKKEKEQVEVKVLERTKELQVATLEINNEKAKLLASINSLSIGFVVFNTQNEIVMANNSVNRMTNMALATWTTKDLQNFFGNTVDLNAYIDKAEKEDTEGLEVNVNDRYYKINFNHIDDPKIQNAILGVIITIGDITESKILDRAKDEFFSIASHELRTPLTAIMGNTALIQEHYQSVLKDKDLAEMIGDMHEASIRLIKIVNDFLDSSRLQQKKIEFKKDKVEVIKLSEDTVKELLNNATQKGLTLGVEKGTEKEISVIGDAERIKQVLVNLIGNAIKFTEKGGITVTFVKEGTNLKVNISDTGGGIPKENQTLLFRKFQQAGDKILTRDATQGTGMGLYISRMLMEGMGGSVDLVSSEEGKGTTFAFILPLA